MLATTLLLALHACALPDDEPRDAVCSTKAAAEESALAGIATARQTLRFVRNDGQWDIPARFVVEHGAWAARIAPGSIGIQAHEPNVGGRLRGAFVRLVFEGAAPQAPLVGEDRLPGVHHYLIGRDESSWQRNVPLFSRVRYEGLYPGIDLLVRGQDGHLEYDVIVDAEADLRPFVIRCEGSEGLTLDRDGALIIHTSLGDLRQPLPITWAEYPDGRREPLPCRYRLIDEQRYAFVLGRRPDKSRIVIDPGLIWASLLGDRGHDLAKAVASGPGRSVFLAGQAGGRLFPTTPGAYDSVWGAGAKAFVSRFDATGSTLIYSTFLGGQAGEDLVGLCVDDNGGAIVTGYTQSVDFPTTPGAYDRTRTGDRALFVTHLNPTGTALIASTFLEGSGSDFPGAIARNEAGLITVVGGTNSTDFPTTANAYDRTLNDVGPFFLGDAFVSVFSPDLSSLQYSSFVGGSHSDAAASVDIDSFGNIILGGGTNSANFPITPGAFDSTLGQFSGWVARIDGLSSSLRFATFLSGSVEETVRSVAFSPDGSTIAVGVTESADFPTTSGALDRSFDGGPSLGRDGFVVSLNPDGNAIYSTFLGGSGEDELHAVAVDALGTAIVTGDTKSMDFPVSPGAFQTDLVEFSPGAGGQDSVLTRLSSDGSRIVYSTYFGGEAGEIPEGLALGPDHRVAIGGRTRGSGFPATEGAWDTRPSADVSFDAWAAVLTLGPHVMLDGVPKAGASVRFIVESAPLATVGHVAQVLWSCSGTQGIPLPTTSEQLPLSFDACTQLSLSFAPLLRSVLDATGRAETPWITLPNQLPVGLSIHAAAFSWDSSTGQISSVSCPLGFITQ